MNQTIDGNNRKPVPRNPNPAAGGSVKQGAPVKRAVNDPSARQPQRITQRPVKQGQRSVQQVQRTVQQAQRPVQQRKPVPVKQAKPVKQKEPKEPVEPMKILKPLVIGVACLMVVLVGVRVYQFFKEQKELLKQEVTIEAGTVKPDVNMFFTEMPAYPQFVSCNLNFDEVRYDIPQTVRFNIKMYGLNYPCRLIVQDTVAPKGEGVQQKIFSCEEMPGAITCLTGIDDVTDCTATWKDVPDMSMGGDFICTAVLTDASGNETEIGVPFSVTRDSTPPVIVGARDLEVYIGDPVRYREGIEISDDYDASPELTIDTSGVNLNEPGTYEVKYIVKDFTGNETEACVNIKVANKPEGYIEPEVLYEKAREILDSITEPGMTDEEVALQIVWWCRYNIRFILRTDTRSWTEAAYNAFISRTGNCYSTAYAVKALFDVAGLENMIIERYPYQTATHFWNYVKLNGEWYHCDATWREGYDSYFFMYTTAELLDFWQGGWNGFQFKQSLYPESAAKSVQNRIDYKNHTIKDA